MTFWIKHPRSNKNDAMLTLSVLAVGAVIIRFLFSNMTFGCVTFGQVDSTVIAALLTPVLGAYTARKYSDGPEAMVPEEPEPEESSSKPKKGKKNE